MLIAKIFFLGGLIALLWWLFKGNRAPATTCRPTPCRRPAPRASCRSVEKAERLETLAELHSALHKTLIPLVLGCIVIFGIGPHSPGFKLLVAAVPMYAFASGTLGFIAFFARHAGKRGQNVAQTATLIFMVSIALWVVWAALASGALMLQDATHQPFAGAWCFMPWEPWVLRLIESAKALF